MNMPKLQYNQVRLTAKADNAAHLIACANARWQNFNDINSDSSALSDMLDQRFPLEHGSHAQVKDYVIYYNHLLAFFADGGQSGLKEPCQYVALCGHKCSPDSIVLRENGLHIELIIDRSGNKGSQQLAGIDEVKVEMSTALVVDFTELNDPTAKRNSDETQASAHQNYAQLMTGQLSIRDAQNQLLTMNKDRTFTGKDGEEYTISGCSPTLICHSPELNTQGIMQSGRAVISEVLVA